MATSPVRKGCAVIGVVVRKEVKRRYDAIVGYGQRSREIERQMVQRIIEHEYANSLNHADVEKLLVLLG